MVQGRGWGVGVGGGALILPQVILDDQGQAHTYHLTP
jgi:hypothetical protein